MAGIELSAKGISKQFKEKNSRTES